MKMLKRWISVCLVILLLAGVAFDHSSLIGSTVEAAGLEETDGAEPAETPDASEETTDVPSLLSEGDGSDTPAPEEQTVTNTETETEAPAEKTETKQEESTEPEKQTVTNTDTETKAPAKKTETKQEESTESAKQTVTNTDNETKEPVTKTSDDVSKESAQPSAYKEKYEDDSIIISVSAEAGIVPEGAELSVTPIEKTEITDDMSEEDKAKAEEINAQYDLTEKKLNEDSAENEETMEGFLAYDISFLVNGEEVEPSGDVKVVMDFKEAAIPEGVSEDAAVAVKHLKEDETAEDGVVVEDMAEKADVQTTDKAEVEKVELTSDNFSTYAVAWAARWPSPYNFTTVDTDSTGLNINLFDYGSDINSKTYGTSYRFVGRWGVGVSDYFREKDKDESFCQGLVNRNLGTDGIPIASSNNESLAYLFSTTSGNDVNVKETYSNLTGLFQRNGQWYSYDSSTNHAQLTGNELVVYNQALVPQYGYNNSSDFMVGNFLPFNDITESRYDHYNTVKGVDIFNVHEAKEDTALWFGMTIDGTFYQPSNGKVNGENMVFEFAGDDDVWVFIDNVLVLDIGGIHGKVSGSINFATGDVFVDGVAPTTLEELYRDAYKEANPNASPEAVNSYVNNIIDSETHTFKDYTLHKMNFFYLERGGGASNCKLDFNLAMINKNSVSVGKEITDVDTSKYEDVQFEYLIQVGENGTSLQPYKNKTYKIYNLDDRSYTGETGTTDSNGHFWLKHNQLAVFEEDKAAGSSGIDENLYYKVTELNVNSQEYNEIYINRTDIFSVGEKEEVSQDGTITGNETNQVYNAPSPVYQVSETGQVIFYNRCSEYNKRELHIKKEMSSGQTEDTFNMTVTLGGELYSGEYFLIDAEGSTHTKTATDGIIPLEVGQEAVIDDIPAGTTFKVKEEELNPAEYNAPTYTVTNGGESPVTEGGASGVTVLGEDSEVVVTNSPYVYVPTPAEKEVPHSKQIDWLGDTGNNTDTKLRGDYYYRLYLDVTGIPTEEPDPADILLILDYSSSMNSNYGSGTRWEAVQESARTAVKTLLPSGSNNRVGIVWFDKNTTDYDNVDFTADKEKLLSSIGKNKPSSGTNYQAAFITAQEMLEKSRADGRNQFVVFVTDGEPYQWVNSSGESVGTGPDDAKYHAIEQAKEFNGLSGFYAVSVGRETGKEFLQTIVDNVNAGISDTIEANNEAELVSTFQQILGSITRQISNVTIKDDLSRYVEFVNESGKTLAEQGDSGTVLETSIALKVTKTDKSGKVEKLTASRDYTYQITEDTVSVNFGPEYFLDPGAKYTISFNVKLTDEAFTDYETNNKGYGGTQGDSGTDYGNNSTSSGKDGFYSNDEATFTYTVDEKGEATTKIGNYDKPVVQVHDRADWEIYKTSSTDFTIKLAGAEFKLIPIQEIPDDLDNLDNLISNPGNIYYKGVSQLENEKTANVSELGYIQWSKVENGSESAIDNETAIPAGRYILAETKAPTGYSLSEVKWLVEVKYMEEPEIRPILTGGSYGNAIDAEETTTNNKKLYVLEIDNTPLYALPSAGGPGIYWYTIGGMLLMIAGSLILYKNKRREVLERK